MKRWIITVKPVVKEIHHIDFEVEGNYIRHALTEEAVLDWFHSAIPIKILDDFDISVKEYPYGLKDCKEKS